MKTSSTTRSNYKTIYKLFNIKNYKPSFEDLRRKSKRKYIHFTLAQIRFLKSFASIIRKLKFRSNNLTKDIETGERDIYEQDDIDQFNSSL